MAVLFNADGDEDRVTASLFDSNAAYTWCAWIYPTLVNGAYHMIFTIGEGTDTQDVDVLSISNGNTLMIQSYKGATGSTQVVGTPSANTWYFVAVVRSAANAIVCYLNTSVSPTLTTDVTGRIAPDTLRLGNAKNANTVELNGRMAHAKLWTRALSAAELVNEARLIRPVHPASPWAWWPLLAGDRTRDWSGNGHTLTEVGTLADAADPGIPFGAAQHVLYNPAAAAPPAGNTADPLNLYRRGLRRYWAGA